MAARGQVRLSTRVQRKDPRLPVYLVIPGKGVRRWELTGTTVVEGAANGHAFGRRTLKRWGKDSDDWFMELTAVFCRQAGLEVGACVELELELADTSTPGELEDLLSSDDRLATAWRELSEAARREAGEHIRAGKAPATRRRRAASIAQRLLQG